MNYRLFSRLLRFARLSRSYNEFVADVPRVEGWDDSIADTGILYSVWRYSRSGSVRTLIDMMGWSRARFCREYGLTQNRVADWEKGKTMAPRDLLDLLAYAVIEEVHQIPKANQTAGPDEEDAQDAEKEQETEAKSEE